jgi:hypothetical protein
MKELEAFESASLSEIDVQEGETVRKDWLLKIITPGAGSKFYYPEEVLKRDGPKAFPKGTQMFMDHATAEEDKHRPEGSLQRQAAVFTSEAYWDDKPLGPGLYSKINVFNSHKEFVRERFQHGAIGASIRAMVLPTQTVREGKQVIESLRYGRSVDFVTRAGAGGALAHASESAADRQPKEGVMEINQAEYDSLKAAAADLATLKAAKESSDQKIVEMQKTLNESLAKSELGVLLTESKLPEISQKRITRVLNGFLPVKEGAFDADAFKARVTAEITQEKEDLKVLGFKAEEGGSVKNMGNGGQGSDQGKSKWAATSEADTIAKLKAQYLRMGYSEAVATKMANA